jgi:hypothetical protein
LMMGALVVDGIVAAGRIKWSNPHGVRLILWMDGMQV